MKKEVNNVLKLIWNDFEKCEEVATVMYNTLFTHNQDGTEIKPTDVLDEANYRLDTYKEEGHCNHDLKYMDRTQYWKERQQLQYYVNKWSKRLNHEPNYLGFCNEYDSDVKDGELESEWTTEPTKWVKEVK